MEEPPPGPQGFGSRVWCRTRTACGGASPLPRRSLPEIQACICLARGGRPEVQEGPGSAGRRGARGDRTGQRLPHPGSGGSLSELRFQIGKGRLSPGPGGKGLPADLKASACVHRASGRYRRRSRIGVRARVSLPYGSPSPAQGSPCASRTPGCAVPHVTGTRSGGPAWHGIAHSCQGSGDLRYVASGTGRGRRPEPPA